MKLRCTSNSIRIRVRKSDIAKLLTKACVQESIFLGNDALFRFSLSFTEADKIKSEMSNNHLEIKVPIAQGTEWVNSEVVGIEADKILTNGEKLHILIEKDFPCLDREESDRDDTFFELVKKENAC